MKLSRPLPSVDNRKAALHILAALIWPRKTNWNRYIISPNIFWLIIQSGIPLRLRVEEKARRDSAARKLSSIPHFCHLPYKKSFNSELCENIRENGFLWLAKFSRRLHQEQEERQKLIFPRVVPFLFAQDLNFNWKPSELCRWDRRVPGWGSAESLRW